MSEALLSLAERVSALRRPNYDVSLAIAYWCYRNGGVAGINYDPALWIDRNCWDPTTSIDSAMSLVPANYPSRVVGSTDDGRCYAALAGNDMHMMAEDPEEFYVGAEAATYALALTAASLRALAQPTVTQP